MAKPKFTIETQATPAITPVPLQDQPQNKPVTQAVAPVTTKPFDYGFDVNKFADYVKNTKNIIPSATNINTPPVKLPEPIKTSTTENLGMATDSTVANINANSQVQTESEKAKADLAKTRDGILASFKTEGSDVEKAYNDEQYIQKKAKAVQIQNELTAMEKSYRDEINALDKNTEGKSTAHLNAEKNKVTDRYNNNRANVSIAYNTALGDYQAAKDAVDLKVQSIKTYNDNQLKYYGMVKDAVFNDMTESEKVQANNIQREKEAKAAIINDTYANVVNTAAENGASASVLSAIDAAARDPKATAASITAAAGRYNVKPETASVGGTAGGVNNPVISTILGSGKFTKDQVNMITNAINNGDDPATVIKNQAKNIMGQTEATELGKYEVARDQMSSVNDLLQQYYDAGGKTGIFSGNYEKVLNKLGTLDDPKLVSIATKIATSLQKYRNAVSGTAYSVQEGKDIASIFPGINKSEGLNNAIIQARLDDFNDTVDSMYRKTLGSAYDSIKPQKTQDVAKLSNEDLLGKINNTISSWGNMNNEDFFNQI